MGKTSNRVKNYVSAKGKVQEMSLMDIYYKTVELRTVLCDIAHNHKRWGSEWYEFVEMSMFKRARLSVIANGKGYAAAYAVEKIDELADLEAAMKVIEEGKNK